MALDPRSMTAKGGATKHSSVLRGVMGSGYPCRRPASCQVLGKCPGSTQRAALHRSDRFNVGSLAQRGS